MDAYALVNYLEPLLLALVLLWALIGLPIRAFKRKNRPAFLPNTAILLSYYTETVKQMLPLKKGKIGDMRYSAIAILGDMGGPTSNHALIFMVELPFTTRLHLLGIPKKAGAVQLNPAWGGGIMERVHLEGDYNNYFSLFCEKGMQTQARYILDPKAMVFTLDFCQSHNWEIIGHELHFLQSGGMKSDEDPTLMYKDIQKFVDEIRPALEIPFTEARYAHLSPKVRIPVKKYRCPVCSGHLEEHSGYYACPKQHGMLLQGSKLPLVRSGEIKNPSFGKSRTHQNKILCPVCGNPMQHVGYGGSDTIIDTCTRCPFRWLDAGELAPKVK